MSTLKQLIFATGNPNKIREVAQMLAGQQIQVKSMKEIGCEEELPETQETIIGNALQKARYLHTHYHYDCFAEDTGLEIDCLNGEPGVYSARYAGESRDAEANMALVLTRMQDCQDRSARFRTVIALLLNGQEHTFEGTVNGTIALQKSGTAGFGYDPIFIPDGYSISFAEMGSEEKNKISHRGRAMLKFQAFVKNLDSGK